MTDAYLDSLLGKNEAILLVARQHWLVLLVETISEILLTLVVLVLTVILAVVVGPLALLGLLILIAPAISTTRDFLYWYNRKYVITSRRVIQISGVISKNVADSSLEKVNDVKLAQSFFGRLLGYGDIEILTASELGVNKIQRIGNPILYKTTMVNAKAQLESGEGIRTEGGDVPALISQLDSLRQKGVITDQEFQEKKAKLLSKL
ncbi:MAG: PH domain-containing protein [Anaerolineales bacterium]|nr:PH domain-containing protein [Anaerolineales bacterium]